MHPTLLTRFILLMVLMLIASTPMANTIYQSEEDFLAEIFPSQVPEADVIWMRGEVKKQVKEILGHTYASLRIRYWAEGKQTAWVLDEIGKERPITTGIVINDHKISKVKVLAFRESRGGEVRHDFFTEQFLGAQLTTEQQLDRSIDGITGATLSVRALKKLALLALYLDSQLNLANDS